MPGPLPPPAVKDEHERRGARAQGRRHVQQVAAGEAADLERVRLGRALRRRGRHRGRAPRRREQPHHRALHRRAFIVQSPVHASDFSRRSGGAAGGDPR